MKLYFLEIGLYLCNKVCRYLYKYIIFKKLIILVYYFKIDKKNLI